MPDLNPNGCKSSSQSKKQLNLTLCPNCKGKGRLEACEPNFTEDLCAVCYGSGKVSVES